MGQCKHQFYLGCSLRLSSGSLCNTKNDLMSSLESNSPLDYPILTPFVSLVSLCASFKVGLIHSLVTLTLTNIDHVSIMKSSVSPTPKRDGITVQSDPKHSSVHGNLTPPDPYIGSIGSKNRRCIETHNCQAGQSHLMKVRWTFALPERRHHSS